MKSLLKHWAKIRISKKRKEQLERFAFLINVVKKASSVYEVQGAIAEVVEFRRELESEDPLLVPVGNLVDYLLDTKHQTENGYHKSRHTNWETCIQYPDINDYVKLGTKISQW